MSTTGSDETRGSLTRRDALKKGALIGGTALWVTPVVQTIGMTGAFAQTASGAGNPPPGGPPQGGNPPPGNPPPGGQHPSGNPPGGQHPSGNPPGGTPPGPGNAFDVPTSPARLDSASFGQQLPATQNPAASHAPATNSGSRLARTGQNVEHTVEIGGAATVVGTALWALTRSKDPNPDAADEGDGSGQPA